MPSARQKEKVVVARRVLVFVVAAACTPPIINVLDPTGTPCDPDFVDAGPQAQQMPDPKTQTDRIGRAIAPYTPVWWVIQIARSGGPFELIQCQAKTFRPLLVDDQNDDDQQ